MAFMKVLFIGGTGLISSACTRLALERGIDLYLLNRGGHPVPDGAKSLVADINGEIGDVAKVLARHHFDVVVDWIAFTPEQVQRDIGLFRGLTRQYVFISSASAYQKPVSNYLIREDTPLCNPFWDYSRNKIAAEEVLLKAYCETGFPGIIVRPSLTYGDTQIPLVVNSWSKPYTVIERMRRGKPVIVPGDGTSLWTITHNTDFARGLVGLFGHAQAVGHAFHITTDEVLAWDQIYRITAEAAGVEPKLAHIATDFITTCLPGETGGLQGDKVVSVVFDNSKIKRFVPGYEAVLPYAAGIRRTLAWFDADSTRREVDRDLDAKWDRILAAYAAGLEVARTTFSTPT
jgi:nucleoside-diphosphate-sugar epimerase